jgi:hypothetical protein
MPPDFLKITGIGQHLFFHGKSYVNSWTKIGWAIYNLGAFFPNSSGHPGRSTPNEYRTAEWRFNLISL